jgi:6-pyruvoyltetrahydropterin/6-carboxytetrahydropterin synthase
MRKKNNRKGGRIMLSVTKIMEFEAAHRLEGHKGKCKNLHGHRYKLECTVGIADNYHLFEGMVIDFGDLKETMKEMVDKYFDHYNINDWFEGLPTAENMVLWIKSYIQSRLLPRNKLVAIKLWETSSSYAEWREE